MRQYLKMGLRYGRQLMIGCFLVVVSVILAAAVPVRAETTYHDSDPDDYITERFDVSVTVDEDHVMHVREEIDVNFIRPHHGITRYIPYDSQLYKISRLRVKGGKKDVEDVYAFSDGYVMGDRRVRIGDADITLTGQQFYVITYDLVCNEDDDLTRDFLSLDLLPTGWDTSIREADLTLTLPEGIETSGVELYTGSYGETVDLRPQAQWSETGDALHLHLSDLEQGDGVTIRAALPEDYWKGARSHSWIGVLYGILMAALAGLLIFLRVRVGRRQQVVQTVEFEPPEGMTPAEIGYVVDGHIDRGDMSSMLMYFADKGYLSIREYKKGKYEAVLEQGINAKEKSFARTLFTGMFSGSERDANEKASVKLNKLPENYGTSVKAAEAALKNFYTGKNRLYTKISEAGRAMCLFLAVAAAVLAVVLGAICCWRYGQALVGIPVAILMILGMVLFIGAADRRASMGKLKGFGRSVLGIILFVIGLGIAAICSSMYFAAGTPQNTRFLQTGEEMGRFYVQLIVPAVLLIAVCVLAFVLAARIRMRTQKGAELLGKILGFREFIRTAETDRLRVLQDEDPSYFFRVMPYAYVMGLSTQWAKKFTDLKVQKPAWYTSSDPGGFVFSTMWYSRMTSTATRSYSGGFSNMPDSGSHGSFSGGGGGFSGGGFSGGGFGGGGGGAW